MSEVNVAASRVGRKPVPLPSGVEAKLEGNVLAIKGPKGKQNVILDRLVDVVIDKDTIQVQPKEAAGYTRKGSGSRKKKSIDGTTRANIANIIYGVTHLFEKKLLLVGVGYKAQAKGKVLSLTLGFSHPVEFPVPEGITIETPSVTEILVKGVDKDLVGLVSAKIRAYRPPEPYKGKGIRYANEQIIRKETKKK